MERPVRFAAGALAGLLAGAVGAAPQRSEVAPAGELEALVAEAHALDLGDVAAARDWLDRARRAVGGENDVRDGPRAALEALLAPAGASPDHGWSVPRRVALVERWEAAVAPGGAWAGRDGAAGAPPGLVPIGADPVTGLREYWHVASGAEPRRDERGALVLEPGAGLVLVALPGGAFRMGAQATDPDAPDHDPRARPDEAPRDVRLAPFLVSKYEVTQAQWRRLTGANPSYYGADGRWDASWTPDGRAATGLQPVENVSWIEARAVLASVGLALPTEAQWEYAARGGTNTPWWTGADRDALAGRVNLLDRSTARAGADWPTLDDWPELDDGWTVHAPVGTFAANPFGLHEVHGNVWEWCLDAYGPYADLPAVDPLRAGGPGDRRVLRGGSWHYPAPVARSACRGHRRPGRDANGRASNNGGLRPAASWPR